MVRRIWIIEGIGILCFKKQNKKNGASRGAPFFIPSSYSFILADRAEMVLKICPICAICGLSFSY